MHRRCGSSARTPRLRCTRRSRRPRGGAEANVAAHHVRSRGAPLCSTPRQDRGTAGVMNDRSPSPRSSRGLSTLCPPRLFGIGDRRHGQSVDNPASRSAIDPAGDQFQCRRGSSCRKGAVSDGARHGQNIALFIGRLLVVPMPVPRAAHPRRLNIARFKSEPARAEHRPFMRRRSARHMDHGGPVGRAAARPQEEMEKGDVPLLGGADPGESAPALKWATFRHWGPSSRPPLSHNTVDIYSSSE